MKSIFLLRHAKSSWADARLDDLQRPLNKRGLRDAPIMGRRFRERGEKLDLVLSSPATRAIVTADLFIEAAELSSKLIGAEDGLYFSSRCSIGDIIRAQNEPVESLMLVFHNPAITQFANSISPADRVSNIPTCGLLKLVSDIDRWRNWSVKNTQFQYFDYPKKSSV